MTIFLLTLILLMLALIALILISACLRLKDCRALLRWQGHILAHYVYGPDGVLPPEPKDLS